MAIDPLDDVIRATNAFSSFAGSLSQLYEVRNRMAANKADAIISKQYTDFMMRQQLAPGADGRVDSENFQSEFDALNERVDGYMDSISNPRVRDSVKSTLSGKIGGIKLGIAQEMGPALIKDAQSDFLESRRYKMDSATDYTQALEEAEADWADAKSIGLFDDESFYKMYNHEIPSIIAKKTIADRQASITMDNSSALLESRKAYATAYAGWSERKKQADEFNAKVPGLNSEIDKENTESARKVAIGESMRWDAKPLIETVEFSEAPPSMVPPEYKSFDLDQLEVEVLSDDSIPSSHKSAIQAEIKSMYASMDAAIEKRITDITPDLDIGAFSQDEQSQLVSEIMSMPGTKAQHAKSYESLAKTIESNYISDVNSIYVNSLQGLEPADISANNANVKSAIKAIEDYRVGDVFEAREKVREEKTELVGHLKSALENGGITSSEQVVMLKGKIREDIGRLSDAVRSKKMPAPEALSKIWALRYKDPRDGGTKGAREIDSEFGTLMESLRTEWVGKGMLSGSIFEIWDTKKLLGWAALADKGGSYYKKTIELLASTDKLTGKADVDAAGAAFMSTFMQSMQAFKEQNPAANIDDLDRKAVEIMAPLMELAAKDYLGKPKSLGLTDREFGNISELVRMMDSGTLKPLVTKDAYGRMSVAEGAQGNIALVRSAASVILSGAVTRKDPVVFGIDMGKVVPKFTDAGDPYFEAEGGKVRFDVNHDPKAGVVIAVSRLIDGKYKQAGTILPPKAAERERLRAESRSRVDKYESAMWNAWTDLPVASHGL